MKSIDNTKSRLTWPFGGVSSPYDCAPKFCLLCGGPQDVIGVFVPDNPEDWGAPKGKDRRFVYALCEQCFRKPDMAINAEKVILSMISGGVPFVYNVSDFNLTQPPVTQEEMLKAPTDLVNAKGFSVASGVLRRFGIQSLQDLPPNQYGLLMTAVQKEMIH